MPHKILQLLSLSPGPRQSPSQALQGAVRLRCRPGGRAEFPGGGDHRHPAGGDGGRGLDGGADRRAAPQEGQAACQLCPHALRRQVKGLGAVYAFSEDTKKKKRIFSFFFNIFSEKEIYFLENLEEKLFASGPKIFSPTSRRCLRPTAVCVCRRKQL